MSGWRRWSARWSGAEAALAVAWGAFAAGLLAVALARDSVGVALIGMFCVWQMSDVWTAAQAESERRGDSAIRSK